MRIAIGYPPLESEKGIALLSQNRQFQWFPSSITAYYIYPVIPASAASLLKHQGHDVYWLDGIAQKKTYEEWRTELIRINPDVIMLETKTPVVKKHWKIINDLKKALPKLNVVLVGDHVTAEPEESMKNCLVDFIATSGDYDFLLLNIVQYLEHKKKLEPGIWYRDEKNKIKNSGKYIFKHDLNSLPEIDRELTDWKSYAYKNSVFFSTPGTYTMFGRDCWWGKCTFCSWTTLFPGNNYRVISVEKALHEVKSLVEKLRVREIMDDSGTFPVGKWLTDFCHGMIRSGLNKKVKINCNMRFNSSLKQADYDLMKKAGFRFILYGLESASQKTLNRIHKNLQVSQIEEGLAMAKKAGLSPHVTVMVGYPWEERDEIENTIAFVRGLFKKGIVDTMQATVVIPYPGTPLFDECRRSHWLKTEDWEKYDMRQTIMKTKVSQDYIVKATARLFSVSIWNKEFITRTLSMLTSFDGQKYFSIQVVKYFAKLLEFK